MTAPSSSQSSPGQYETGKGCLTLTLISIAAVGALIIFVVVFGNVRA